MQAYFSNWCSLRGELRIQLGRDGDLGPLDPRPRQHRLNLPPLPPGQGSLRPGDRCAAPAPSPPPPRRRGRGGGCVRASPSSEADAPGAGSSRLPLLRLLLAPEGQQLGIDGEHLGGGGFEGAALFHERSDIVDPVTGDAFDPLLPVDHEGEGPQGVALLRVGAATVGFPASPVGEHQRAGERGRGDPEAPQDRVFPLPETRRGGALGVAGLNLSVLLHTDCRSTPPPWWIRDFAQRRGGQTLSGYGGLRDRGGAPAIAGQWLCREAQPWPALLQGLKRETRVALSRAMRLSDKSR